LPRSPQPTAFSPPTLFLISCIYLSLTFLNYEINCSEQEFIRSSNTLPRLERQLRRNNNNNNGGRKIGAGGGGSNNHNNNNHHRHKRPLPEDLGEEWIWPQNDPASPASSGPKIAFIVTTAESVSQIKLWMAYHRALGVSIYYLFVEGQASTPEAIAALRTEPGVTIIPGDEDLQSRHANSRIWKENWLSAFFNKPCNHELFVRQSLNMEMGISLAQKDKADWLLHIDTDELLYPSGTRDYSLKELLGSVPLDVDLLVFPNYESLAEKTDVEDPFLEVTLFKRSYSHVENDAYFAEYGTVSRGNPNYFTTYGNGKSAARVVDGLRPNGAHRWHNYNKTPKEWSSEQAAVLHYTYNRFSDLKSRRDRCDCKPTEEDAERCFILPFDRMAFLEASLKTDDKLMDFFKERLVWEDNESVVKLVRKGLFARLYEPQLMIRGLRQALHGGSTTSNGTVSGSTTVDVNVVKNTTVGSSKLVKEKQAKPGAINGNDAAAVIGDGTTVGVVKNTVLEAH
jgi:Glycosyl transferase family 2